MLKVWILLDFEVNFAELFKQIE